jgi:hypothetical protein
MLRLGAAFTSTAKQNKKRVGKTPEIPGRQSCLLAMHSHQLLIYKKTTIVELNPFRAAQHEATQDEEPTRSEPSLLLKILESFETHWLYATAAQLYRV